MNGKNLMLVLALVALVFGFGFNGTASAAGGLVPNLPEVPVFESNGYTTFDDGSGSGWWYMAQYEGRVSLNIGATSTERIIGIESSMTVDKYDSSFFSFRVSVRTLDGAVPTGWLDFSRNSSNGVNSLSSRVHDELVDVFVGWDNETDTPIFEKEMRAELQSNLFANVRLNAVNDDFGRWTSEWYDGEGNLYFSRSGNEFHVDGRGRFLGDDPSLIGLGMVASGAATFGTVPEPATIGLLSLGIMGIIARRRKRS